MVSQVGHYTVPEGDIRTDLCVNVAHWSLCRVAALALTLGLNVRASS